MSVRRRPVTSETNTETFGEGLLTFLMENWWWLIALLVIIATFIFMIRLGRKRYAQIEKIWVFILFFLTKRQMMLPLVIGLSQKDKLIDRTTQQKLLEIRERCREVSFKKSPVARLELEKEVSEILFNYFSALEKKDRIKAGTKFQKIVQDLEFIDAKLVQMQALYNRETTNWNKQIGLPGLKALIKPFGLKPFEPFA